MKVLPNIVSFAGIIAAEDQQMQQHGDDKSPHQARRIGLCIVLRPSEHLGN
jgi:hypothetical protein